MYTGQLKENRVHLEKRIVHGTYDKVDLARFVCSCIYLSGSFSLLQEP
jgi:hypothetical protein